MRRKGTLVAMFTTALVTLFAFSFAAGPAADASMESRSGVLWVTWILAGTIGIDRAFRDGGDGRLLEALLVAPASRAAIYYGRTASTYLFVLLIAAATLPLFLVLFAVTVPAAGAAWLAAVSALTLLGMTAAGVLLSAMTFALRGGEVLLRVLLLPLMIPALAAAVHGTSAVLAGGEPPARALVLLGAFDLVFLGAGHLLFEHVVEDQG
jgi:heme exporter protein B